MSIIIQNLKLKFTDNKPAIQILNVDCENTGLDDLVYFCQNGKYPDIEQPEIHISIVDGNIIISG